MIIQWEIFVVRRWRRSSKNFVYVTSSSHMPYLMSRFPFCLRYQDEHRILNRRYPSDPNCANSATIETDRSAGLRS